MNSSTSRTIFVVCLALFSLVSPPGFAAEATALVRGVRGNAEVTLADGSREKFRIGKKLAPGAQVKTANESMVDITFSDNSFVVRLKPDTLLTLGKLDFQKEHGEKKFTVTLDLREGGILTAIRIPPGSSFSVKIPHGLVKLTSGSNEFELGSDGNLKCFSGDLDIELDQIHYTVPPGMRLDPKSKAIAPFPPPICRLYTRHVDLPSPTPSDPFSPFNSVTKKRAF